MWNGQLIELKLATESKLERLKREREESSEINSYEESHTILMKNDVESMQNELSNAVIKEEEKNVFSNYRKQLSNNKLKVMSENEKLKVESKELETINDFNLSEIKRVHSVNQKIKTYQQQQIALKAALNNVDMNLKNNKIIFNENAKPSIKSQLTKSVMEITKKKSIFESDDVEDSFDFKLKTHFDGKNGQQLFELQSKYKNDKRFKLDERFIEDQNKEDETTNHTITEFSLEEEKKSQINILKQVLDTNIMSKDFNSQKDCLNKRKMLRFDPTQSDHSKYQIRTTNNSNKIKVTHDIQNKDTYNIQETTVSKNVFYKVNDDLKNTFTAEQQFSVLNLFGHKNEKESCAESEQQTAVNEKLFLEKNPFHYDSSEDEVGDSRNKSNVEINNTIDLNVKGNTLKYSGESLFFKDDDFRLQEGSDFVKRMASANDLQFVDQRRNLKHIIKAKARNCQRKNKPFKKKLGGNARKHFLKMKKAMKR